MGAFSRPFLIYFSLDDPQKCARKYGRFVQVS